MIKAVIFNFNGTIYDSTQYIWKARSIYLEKLGIKISKEEIASYLGRALEDQLRIINEIHHLDIKYESFSKETRKIAKQLMTEANIQPNPGVVELLEELKENKLKIGISSFMPRQLLFEDLDMMNLTKSFNEITTLEDIKNYKPDPEYLLTEADKLKVEPKECVYICDDNEGVIVAKSLGMKTVKLKNNLQKENHEADLVVNSLKDINLKILLEL